MGLTRRAAGPTRDATLLLLILEDDGVMVAVRYIMMLVIVMVDGCVYFIEQTFLVQW